MSRTERRDPRSLSELLTHGNLGSLAAEARRRSELADRIRTVLPPEDAEHLVSAGINDAGELVIAMDSPAWAARVRYYAERLTALQPGDAAALGAGADALVGRRIRVQVSPGAGRTDRGKRQPGTS